MEMGLPPELHFAVSAVNISANVAACIKKQPALSLI
jgi:hypothetical protein